MRKIYLGIALFLGGTVAMNAQRACGTMEHLHELQSQHPEIMQRQQNIEQNTEQAIANNTLNRAVVNIPVVVHVVYRSGVQNISDSQVLTQIQVLNADFRKLNSDASLIPSAFTAVAADAEFNFCLASQTPSGSAFNGINRVSSTRTSSFGTNDAVKSASTGGVAGWDPNRYLNMWVCEIGGSILGYATFPGTASSTTDGIVIDYRYFGTNGTATAPFNKGRTATHEVGHWLNLRHIWGDATCGSDFVNDTPTHNTSNGGCPTYPHYSTCSGAPIEMTMNYMDYTDDACMYMFSAGQKSRMQALFGAGGARAALLTSPACGGAPQPTCTDGIQNGDETGIDCGGSNCAPCSQPSACLNYCTSRGNTTQDEYIASVSLGNYTNNSGSNGGYASYASSAVFTKGSSYSLSITPAWTSTLYNEYSRVWADWNGDGDFDDAGELIYDQGSASTASPLNGNFTVPATAVTGNTTIRVSMKYNAASTTCETFAYGEVEDYCVSIENDIAPPPVCNTPSGLSASSITTSSASISFNAVTGAVSYNLDYKLSSVSTWSSASVSSTTNNFTGLNPSTSYDLRVQTVCSFGTSSYSAVASFTTAAAPVTCSDIYESNNSRTAAKVIPLSTNIQAALGTSTDKDWFRFNNSSSQRNVKVSLSNLVYDYDLQLYRGSSRVATSQNGGTTSESIIYNNTRAATTYYAYVYGYNGVFSANDCYTLRAEIGSSSFARLAGETEATEEISDEIISVYPNPNNGSFTVSLMPEADINEPIEIYNHLGQLVEKISISLSKDHPRVEIQLNDLSDGIYFVRVFDGSSYQHHRILVRK
ncbi:MAG: GEVED domain-containing protein [Bacteroidia bacterium]